MNHPEADFETITRHVHDIDAFEVLDAMRDKYKAYNEQAPGDTRPLEFLDLEEGVLMEFLTEQKIDAYFFQKRRNYILRSDSNLFPGYLGYKILTIDPYKIELLLSYQSARFLGNHYASKENFTGMVEHLVYKFVKARLLPFEEVRLEKIANWVEKNAASEPYAQKSISANPQKPTPSPMLRVEESFLGILHEGFKYKFAEEEHQLLLELLKYGKIDTKICFHGNANHLAEFFKRLRYNKKIEVQTLEDLAEWITKHFKISNRSKGTWDVKSDTILQVLKKSGKEPKKGKRILENVAPFIAPSKRKQNPPE